MQGSQSRSGVRTWIRTPERPTYIPRIRAAQRTGPSLVEVAGIWIGLAILLVGMFVTYVVYGPAELYHVSVEGVTGAAGRTLVQVNYPIAFIAIGLAGFSWARLAAMSATMSRGRRRLVGGMTLLAIPLCLVAALPGVVDQGDLDAKLVNVIPALGVLLALVVTVAVIRATGWGADAAWPPVANWLLAGAAAVLVVASLPWLFANFGVYIDDLPLLDRLFMSKEIPEGETLRAVHLGGHHGFDGIVFGLTALALLRPFSQLARGWLRGTLAAVVSLFFVYGVANALEDFWGEQIVKRGTTSFELMPNVTRPELNAYWGVMVLLVVAFTVALVRMPAIGERGEQIVAAA